MTKKRAKGRKLRVDFRRNRLRPRRAGDLTRHFRREEDKVVDARTREAVCARGELSRKRTILVDENEAPLVDPALWRRGTVTSVHGLTCSVDDREGCAWQCTVRRVLRTLMIDQRGSVVVGDRVWLSTTADANGPTRTGVIERVEPRRTVLSRRDRRGREHAIVANVDQLLIVTSVAEPRLKPHLVDRYLVAAAKGGLRPVICFNKVDLQPLSPELEEEDAEESEWSNARLFEEFQRLGYCCLYTSATEGIGLETLRAMLRERVTVLSGQSGSGKSSLINALQPGLNLTVGAVSAENEKGRHTTSYARLVRFDFGGYGVDTPGIRQFSLWDVDPGELEAYFVEFIPYVPKCRFKNCTHREELGCAVIEAVERGAISSRRYHSYLKMLREV